ncbi:uncharacterized protein At2g24330 isoform X1 [Musa acuminata AAA Group]|uniref:(wild Malaysian banana) hypothetical protein n=1 Tax=Musa acuminata subsp. malaccensis TaxID=214687 RepID=A0A804HY43_MUSAM|nr:PREDICTED: uncharacterized protein At2g24330 [Musa acuminata subsp. malaccensis]CAG1860668.1 unnamed protein product [Musa acuminata subsp. malaccensis]
MAADDAGSAGGAENLAAGAPPPPPPPSPPKKQRRGFVARLWHGIFAGRNEDYEKRLQYLSKEEATVHSRMKRRAQSSRRIVRDLIVLSVILEVAAVAYAIMTTRSADMSWKMRAIRVLPMFVLPGLSSMIYSALVSFMRMLDHKDQKTLERLRAERKAKIDELKERTNYYTTQQLIQKYDLDPAAKAAAATVLASKLGADSGLKVYVGDEPNTSTVAKGSDADPVITTGLRNRKQSHARSNSTGSTIVSQMVNETSDELGVDDQEISAQTQKVVEHYKASGASDGGWIARIAALLVGEDPSQSYALICGNCHMHNGLARKEDYPRISYYCPHCHALNTSQQSGEPDSGSSSGRGISYASVDAKYDNNAEVPKLPTGEKDDKEDALEVS